MFQIVIRSYRNGALTFVQKGYKTASDAQAVVDLANYKQISPNVFGPFYYRYEVMSCV